MAETLQDVILIWTCPCCKEQHFYAVHIQRLPFLGSSSLPVRPLKLTRLFTCPVKDEDFMVEFYLIQPAEVTYHKVQTLGLIATPGELDTLQFSTRYYDEARLAEYLRANGVSGTALLVPPEGLRFGRLNIVSVIK